MRQKLFALSVPCLMTGALYRTVPPNNPCMRVAVSIRKWLISKHIKLFSHYSNYAINLKYQALYSKDLHILNGHRRHTF